MADISKVTLLDGQTYNIKAQKLAASRTFNVSGQATGTAQSFDGSQNVSIPITAFKTQGLARPSALRGIADYTLQTLINGVRANRLAFLPADQIIIEKTIDGGITWTDAGVSDAVKLGLFSETRPSVSLPQIDGVRSPLCGIRVTFTAMKYDVPANTPETEKYNYWNSAYIKSVERYNQLRDFYFWINASDGSIGIKIETATGGNPDSWITCFDDSSFFMNGWSGCDYVRISQKTFGGAKTQAGNYWNYRITFMSKGKNGTDDFDTGSKTQSHSIMEIRAYGDGWWNKGNEYAANDKIYTHDANQNVTFPAKVTATSFAGPVNGNATSATTVNGHTVNSDVPANAVFTDTTYTASSPISIDGTTISHSASGVTAASKGDISSQEPEWGDTFKVPSGTVNATGHITDFADHTVKIPDSVATLSDKGLMSPSDKAALSSLDTRLSDVEDTLANIDLSDTDAAIMALALRVAALESHAVLDDDYPDIIIPLIDYDSTTNTLSFS